MANFIKNETIHNLLKKLTGQFGQESFNVVDHGDADLFAVGIARPDNPGVLVYISTYGLSERGYFVELEMPPRRGSDLPYEWVGRYENIDFERVTTLVREHLQLSQERLPCRKDAFSV